MPSRAHTKTSTLIAPFIHKMSSSPLGPQASRGGGGGALESQLCPLPSVSPWLRPKSFVGGAVSQMRFQKFMRHLALHQTHNKNFDISYYGIFNRTPG